MFCFLLSCIFHLSSNYRHDRLANEEDISLEWKELNYISKHKEESTKRFGLMKKEAKMKRKILFLEKEKKSILFFIFFVTIFQNLWPQLKNQFFGSLFLACFFANSFFVFKKNWNFFLLFVPYQKD